MHEIPGRNRRHRAGCSGKTRSGKDGKGSSERNLRIHRHHRRRPVRDRTQSNDEKNIKAPVKKGDKVGKATYHLGGQEIGSRDILAAENIEKISYKSVFEDIVEKMML